jgi:hypothetical protein
VSTQHDLIRSLRVDAGSAPRLEDRDRGIRVGAPTKQAGLERLQKLVARLSTLHDGLFAESSAPFCSSSRAWTQRGRMGRSATC